MKPTKPEPILWLSDSRGQYIPCAFAASFSDRAKQVCGVSDEDWRILEAGPEHPDYWDTWCDVVDTARVTNDDGVIYTLFPDPDGDLWLMPIPEGMEWSDEAGRVVERRTLLH